MENMDNDGLFYPEVSWHGKEEIHSNLEICNSFLERLSNTNDITVAEVYRFGRAFTDVLLDNPYLLENLSGHIHSMLNNQKFLEKNGKEREDIS